MWTMRIAVLGGGVVFAGLGFWLSNASATPTTRQAAERCSAQAFGQALVLDERSLTSRTRDLEGRSAEGGTFTVWSQGEAPKLVRIIDYGETGKASTSIYLVDSLTFAVWRTEFRYSVPISSNPSPRTERTVTGVSLYCEGAPILGADVDSAGVIEAVRSAFRDARKPAR